jgi:uncharacterized membrane protein YgcG
MYARLGGGAPIHQPSANYEVTWAGMQRKEIIFIAFSHTHTLFLGSLSAGPCGPIVDNIVIIPSKTPADPVHVNILINGDFESGLLQNCMADQCTMSSAVIYPWMTTANPTGEAAIEIVRVLPGSGQIALNLNSPGVGPAQIYQDVRLKPFHRYRVAIGSRQSMLGGDTAKVGYVQVLDSDGNELLAESFIAGEQWKFNEWEFVASRSPSIRIGFGSSEKGNVGPIIDYASLVDLDVAPVIGGIYEGGGSGGGHQGGSYGGPTGAYSKPGGSYGGKGGVSPGQGGAYGPIVNVKPIAASKQPAYGAPVHVRPMATNVKKAELVMPKENYGPMPTAVVSPMNKQKCHPRG